MEDVNRKTATKNPLVVRITQLAHTETLFSYETVGLNAK